MLRNTVIVVSLLLPLFSCWEVRSLSLSSSFSSLSKRDIIDGIAILEDDDEAAKSFTQQLRTRKVEDVNTRSLGTSPKAPSTSSFINPTDTDNNQLNGEEEEEKDIVHGKRKVQNPKMVTKQSKKLMKNQNRNNSRYKEDDDKYRKLIGGKKKRRNEDDNKHYYCIPYPSYSYSNKSKKSEKKKSAKKSPKVKKSKKGKKGKTYRKRHGKKEY